MEESKNRVWEAKIEESLGKEEILFINSLKGIRSNKISVDFLKNITVNLHDRKSKLSHVANLRVLSARELVITSFNKRDAQPIIKTLLDANLGYNLKRAEGETSYFSLSPMTEEIRKRLIRKCKETLENVKISSRNSRQKILNEIKRSKDLSLEQEKKIKKNIEEIINNWNNKIVKIYSQKVTELSSI